MTQDERIEHLTAELKAAKEENEQWEKQRKSIREEFIKFKGLENEDSIPPINTVVEIRIMIKRIEQLESQLQAANGERTQLNELRYVMCGEAESYKKEIQALREALTGIANLCDNQNPTHESIWRIANALSTPNNDKV